MFAVCFGASLAGLVYFDRWVARRAARPCGPGAASAAELRAGRAGLARLSDLPMMIAIGIGLHNFAEGLAIGRLADPDPCGNGGWHHSLSRRKACQRVAF